MTYGKSMAIAVALIAASALTAVAKPAPAHHAAAAQSCPHLGLLADASRLTDFEGTSNAQFRASLGNEALQCVVKDGTVHMRLKFKVTGALQGAAKNDTRKVPYFVAVMQGSRVLAKQVYSVDIPFSGNARSVSVEEHINRVDIPIEKGWSADDYEVMLGFQLTRDQVNYNRQNAGR